MKLFLTNQKILILIPILLVCFILSYHSVRSESANEKDLSVKWEEELILDKFRERVAPILPNKYKKDDLYLMRWLRANKFNVANAERALIDDLKWRKENRMDTIQDEDWSTYRVTYPYWIEGSDRVGKPILYGNVGLLNFRRAMVMGERNKMIRYVNKVMDDLALVIHKRSMENKNVTQGILIANLEGYNLITHACIRCVPVILQVAVIVEGHMSGYFDKIILINVPSILEPLLQAIQQVVTPPSNKVLKVFGRNKDQWQSYLSTIIDQDQLPLEIGGTKIYPGLDYSYDDNEKSL